MKLAAGDHRLITAAVGRAEEKTSAEIVVVVQPRSGSTADIAWVAGAIVSVLALLAVIFVDVEFDPLHVVPIVFGSGWITFAAVLSLVPPGVIARKRTKRQVDDAAHAAFSRCGVYRTSERTGILVFYSVRERSGRVLVDTGVAHAVSAETRDEWRARLHDCKNAQDLAKLVEDIGERAGQFLPRKEGDVDELSNQAEVSA